MKIPNKWQPDQWAMYCGVMTASFVLIVLWTLIFCLECHTYKVWEVPGFVVAFPVWLSILLGVKVYNNIMTPRNFFDKDILFPILMIMTACTFIASMIFLSLSLK